MPPPDAPPLHILILAAGASRRMRGADKLLEEVDGQPLLRQVAQRALATGLPVTVALPPDRPARAHAIAGLGATQITVPDPQNGMAASLCSGVASLPGGVAVLMLLADLPEITTQDLRLMKEAQRHAPDAILRATAADGTPGHPVVFPPWTVPLLLGLTGDQGARAVLQAHAEAVRPVALPDCHATTDLDTPEDWAAWRSGRE